MELVFLAVMLTSAVSAGVVFLATRSRMLMCLAFVVAPSLSLSFWAVYRLTGMGPSNFIPNWTAGAMIVFPFLFWFFWSWVSEEYKG